MVTYRRLAGEKIVRSCEILQVRQMADRLRYGPGEHVVCNVKLLDFLQPAKKLRHIAHQLVEGDIEHSELCKQTELGRNARVEAAVHENYLIQCLRHVRYASR
jgi:hypothetical protein